MSAFYHYKVLPKTEKKRSNSFRQLFQEFYLILKSFFLKPSISISIIFILIYRFGEAQLVKIAPLFMLDSLNDGGLGLSNVEYGFLYGTLGTACLTIGGIVGGILIAKQGLKVLDRMDGFGYEIARHCICVHGAFATLKQNFDWHTGMY